MEENTLKELLKLEYQSKILKRIREIQNILLNTGAYSNHNIETQNNQFDRLNVPEWERTIINNVWALQTKYSHKLLKELDILIKKIDEELKNDK